MEFKVCVIMDPKCFQNQFGNCQLIKFPKHTFDLSCIIKENSDNQFDVESLPVKIINVIRTEIFTSQS